MNDSQDSINADSGNETDEKFGKSAAECSDVFDEFLDSEDFPFDFVDNNNTGSEDENPALNFSSSTDEIINGLDSMSCSSIDNAHEPPDVEGSTRVDNEIQFSNFVDSALSNMGDVNSHSKGVDLVLDSIDEGNIAIADDDDRGNIGEGESISSSIPCELTSTPPKDEIISQVCKHNKKKLKKILHALETDDTDFLKSAAISRGGLLNDEIRRKVWPKLIGVDLIETSPRPSLKEIEAHPYYGQVVLDVNRSLKRFPPSIKEAQRLTMLDQLVFLIMRVLCRHPDMHYYQGYHDICVTFLLVLGEEASFHVVEKLSRTHLNVFMEKNMEPTVHLLEYMYILIGKESPILKNFLLKSEVGVIYCLSWLITWFGHVLNEYDNVVRLFDFFIVSHPWMPVYLTTAIVLHREAEILKQDCEMASVHSFLSNIPDNLPFEELIIHSLNLFDRYEPKLLEKEHPYVQRNRVKPKKGWGIFQTVSRTIKSAVPANNVALPAVIAAAVLVTAILYQAYKY